MHPYTCETTAPFFVGIFIGLLLSMYINRVTKKVCKYYIRKFKKHKVEDTGEPGDSEEEVPAKDKSDDLTNNVNKEQEPIEHKMGGDKKDEVELAHPHKKDFMEDLIRYRQTQQIMREEQRNFDAPRCSYDKKDNMDDESGTFIARTSGKYATMKELEELQKSNNADKNKNINKNKDAYEYQMERLSKELESKNSVYKQCEFTPHIQAKFNELKLEESEANQC